MAHLSLRLLCVYATLLFSAVASSQRWNGPPQTLPFAHQGSGLGWTPKPTAAPAWPELLRRQEAPHSLCGYVDGNASEPVSCSSAYCGFNTFGGTPVAGCCASTYVSGGSDYLADCNLGTTCYNRGACDSSCYTANLYNYYETCLFPASPYCGKLSYTENGAVSFFCTDTPRLTYFAAYETGTSLSSSQSARVVQSSSSIVVSSSRSSSSSSRSSSSSSMLVSSSTNSITPSPVPFTQSQQTASTATKVSATSTTSSNGTGKLILSDTARNVMILAAAMILTILW